MTYSQLLYRLAAAAIALGAGYLFWVDRVCMPSKAGCRPVQGAPAVVLCLAAAALAVFLLVASTQPRRGKRAIQLVSALIAFVLLFTGAFFLDLFGQRSGG